jgi:hypothetical protein
VAAGAPSTVTVASSLIERTSFAQRDAEARIAQLVETGASACDVDEFVRRKVCCGIVLREPDRCVDTVPANGYSTGRKRTIRQAIRGGKQEWARAA